MDDILEPRRRASDLRFVMQCQTPPRYESCVERTPQEISDAVLSSPRVREAVAEAARRSGRAIEEVDKEAREILKEMAHARSMKWVRTVGYFFSKVLKCLYERVSVNSDQMEKIHALVTKYPVVFVPSHRSYMDFLLLSFVLFHYSLPCPVICAAQDFLNMKFFANVIRHCGGFFIRRSFASDLLYWNIFSEFVQSHVMNGDFPLEFFIEGTRSRTGKSLLPKLGMLSTAMELVIKGRVPDVVLVPVAVSFDRVLEESLYANELLGIPKPKESTSGLFKARSILSENYGTIRVMFGDPMFSKELLVDFGVDRSVYNLRPRIVSALTPDEIKASKRLGLEVLLRQQRLFVASPFAIIAALLLQSPVEGVPLSVVKEETKRLLEYCQRVGVAFDAEVEATPLDSVVDRELRLHADAVELNSAGRVVLRIAEPGADSPSPLFNPALLARASRMVQLSIYRNQALHFLVDSALLVRILSTFGDTGVEASVVFAGHRRLRQLLKPEFLFPPEELDSLSRAAARTLSSYGVLNFDEVASTLVMVPQHPLTGFLDRLLLPFLEAYYLSSVFLLDMTIDGQPLQDPKSNAKLVQSRILRFMLDRGLAQFDVLSLDTLANASQALIFAGLARKSPSRPQCMEIMDAMGLFDLVAFLRPMVPPEFTMDVSQPVTAIPKAKL